MGVFTSTTDWHSNKDRRLQRLNIRSKFILFMLHQPVSIWHLLIVFRILLMLPKWALNQVLGGCNKFQRALGEFIAFHWVQFTIWSTSIGHRFGSRSSSSPCRYGSWGDRTHRRSKSCWSGLREIRSPIASSWCINSEIALPTIWLDDVVFSPWTRILIRC
jgi:hypothetical protein